MVEVMESDGDKMKKKRRTVWVLLFWLAFLAAVAAICYASFQNGEASAQIGKDVLEKLAEEYFDKDAVTKNELSLFTYHFRQIVRTVAFVGLGMLGTATIHLSFGRLPWIVRTLMSAAILLPVAWITEKGKIFLATRHYSYNQMMISVVSVMLGFLLVSAVTLIGDLVHYINRSRQNAF